MSKKLAKRPTVVTEKTTASSATKTKSPTLFTSDLKPKMTSETSRMKANRVKLRARMQDLSGLEDIQNFSLRLLRDNGIEPELSVVPLESLAPLFDVLGLIEQAEVGGDLLRWVRAQLVRALIDAKR